MLRNPFKFTYIDIDIDVTNRQGTDYSTEIIKYMATHTDLGIKAEETYRAWKESSEFVVRSKYYNSMHRYKQLRSVDDYQNMIRFNFYRNKRHGKYAGCFDRQTISPQAYQARVSVMGY